MKRKLWTLCGTLALTLVLYVLSAGPVLRFYIRPSVRLPGEELDADQARRFGLYSKIYAPLYWLTGKSPTVESVLDWYLWKWVSSG